MRLVRRSRGILRVTIETTSDDADCGGVRCLKDLMLLGSTRTFTAGANLTSIVVSGGLATATFTNGTEKGWKALDEVVITGEPALNGTYPVVSGPTATTITFGSSAPDGTYTTPGMTMTTRRIVFSGNYIGLDEESFDRFEWLAITPTSKTSFTATFAKSHAAGAILRGSDHITILNYIRGRGQGTMFQPTSGNHDYGGGDEDWCTVRRHRLRRIHRILGVSGRRLKCIQRQAISPQIIRLSCHILFDSNIGSILTVAGTSGVALYAPICCEHNQMECIATALSVIHGRCRLAYGWRYGGSI